MLYQNFDLSLRCQLEVKRLKTLSVMTGNEIKKIKDTLPSFLELNEEQQKLYVTLSAREMINSILIYDGESGLYENNGELTQYLKKYIEKGHIGIKLTEDEMQQLINEQKTDFAKAKVNTNVYTDCEGVTYNSVTWGDE